MDELILDKNIINMAKSDIVQYIYQLMPSEIQSIILYGSCARGDFTPDSDIDIALLTKCDRLESKKYTENLAMIATQLALKYFVVVNFVCLPYDEFLEKKEWYPYFKNIAMEGEILYG